ARRRRSTGLRDSGGEQLIEEFEMAARDDRPGVQRVRAIASAGREVGAARRAFEQIGKRAAPSRIVALADDRTSVADDVRNFDTVAGEHRYAASEGLDQHAPELL